MALLFSKCIKIWRISYKQIIVTGLPSFTSRKRRSSVTVVTVRLYYGDSLQYTKKSWVESWQYIVQKTIFLEYTLVYLCLPRHYQLPAPTSWLGSASTKMIQDDWKQFFSFKKPNYNIILFQVSILYALNFFFLWSLEYYLASNEDFFQNRLHWKQVLEV